MSSENDTIIKTTIKKNSKAKIIYKNVSDAEKIERPEINISELKKELKDIKNEMASFPKMVSEEIPDDQKQKNVERIIKKWLNLQKTIKEEITLEDVIIKQQENDKLNLQDFFRKFYDIKVKTRRNLEDIKKLKLEKERNIPSFEIEKEVENNLRDSCEPIKNLLFMLRNNYDYLIRLLSLINKEDYSKNQDKINSLVELFNNQFYENILLPNPEQQELLILIYKLLEEDIMPMAGVSPDDFLNNNTFSGIFLSSYSQRQEILGYISNILNPLILSIDNEDLNDYDLSINAIKKNLDRPEKEKKTLITNTKSLEIKEFKVDLDHPNYIRRTLLEHIPKTNIKFKNNFELEAEKEKEDEIKLTSKDDDNLYDSDNNLIYVQKPRRTFVQRSTLVFGKDKDNEYNNEYKNDLNKEKLLDKINKENDPELRNFYIKHLEQINYYPNKYTNEGIIKIIEREDKKQAISQIYKSNFLNIRSLIENLLQTLVDKIITFPYPLRCLCKIIHSLISKKYQFLSKYEVNSYIGKFLFGKCIFPVLGLEKKIFINPRIFSSKTKMCLDTIISVISKANNSSLFDTYSDPEKTIFNPFIIEIIPILNKFYEKLIDIQLPKVIEDLLDKTNKKMEQTFNKKIFNFRHKKKKVTQAVVETPKGPDTTTMPPPLFQYFDENPDEILHLQSICFSVHDIKFMIELIGRNIQIFSDLPKYNFFTKTYKRILNEDDILTRLIEEESNSNKRYFYVIFKDDINKILGKLLLQKKKDRSTFESSEQDSDLVCKRVKFCIKTILKGLNLLNNKDFAYLNFAQSTDKFFSALKYTLEELGEYSELSSSIPLKWYSQYIFNYKKELGSEYQNDDFSKLYEEIYKEETNILNELKSLSNTLITRDGMNLRCAEKIMEKSEYVLRRIEEAKKYVQVEKFVKTKKVEVCIMPNPDFNAKESSSENDTPVFIKDIKTCPHSNIQNENNPYHITYVLDFIKKFSDNKEIPNNIRLRKFLMEDAKKGDRENKAYEIIGKYMECVKKQIKDPENKNLFGEIKEKETAEFLEKIENHIARHIYKFVYPQKKSDKDLKFFEITRDLEWIQPEHLEIKKLYVNQLKFAEKYIKQIDKEKSVFDKLECIHNAYVTMNNTVKFISGKNEDAGQDELTPLFQYILIKSQPEKIYTNIFYIKSILSEADLIGPKGFYVSQMESASDFISQIDHTTLRMEKEEFDKKKEESKKKYKNEVQDDSSNPEMKRKSGIYKKT